jgi:trehalose-phosphatase
MEDSMAQPLFDATREVADRIQQAPHVLLCLDYDGTLTRFVVNPLAANLSQHVERVLLALTEQEGVSVALVSGRDRCDLQARVAIPGIYYAGNHGLEISGPGCLFVEPTAASHSGALQELAAELDKRLQAIPGALVEYKGLTISVHYRAVAADAWDEVRREVHGALANAAHPFVLTTGEKVYEIRPRVYWTKGTAVNWIRERLGKPDVLAIYVGDDISDEDSFAALPEGITVKVGQGSDTAARYSLEGPAEVRKFLEWIEELLKSKAAAPVPGGTHGAPAGHP